MTYDDFIEECKSIPNATQVVACQDAILIEASEEHCDEILNAVSALYQKWQDANPWLVQKNFPHMKGPQ